MGNLTFYIEEWLEAREALAAERAKSTPSKNGISDAEERIATYKRLIDEWEAEIERRLPVVERS